MIGRWHQCLDRSGKVGSILMDLSKAFDCIDHELLIAKLAAYGVDYKTLKVLKSYLSNRFQRTKVGSTLSSWLLILKRVPQGSILGPLLFNIFINDLISFIEKTEICNFADDNTIYSCANDMSKVISNLTQDLKTVLSWFKANQLAANPSKFQMIVLGEQRPISISVENVVITSTESVELLGICIDNKLTFSSYISSLCHTASNRIRSLNRIRPYISQAQSRLLFNSFIISIFSYSPIIWMFCNKSSYREISSIHKRGLKAVYQDFSKSYEELLQTSNYKDIHEVHLCFLLIEVYKTLNNLNPAFMQEFYKPKTVTYTLRNNKLLTLPSTKTSRFGTQSFIFQGCLLWNTIPSDIKSKLHLSTFKAALKSIDICKFCTCRICKNKNF